MVTLEEFEAFQQFAHQRLSQGSVESLQVVLDEWTADRRRQESIEGIQQSLAEHKQGESVAVAEAFREVRDQLGFPQ